MAEAKAFSGSDVDENQDFCHNVGRVAWHARMCELEEATTPAETLQELDRTINVFRRRTKDRSSEFAKLPNRPLQYMVNQELSMYVRHMLATEPHLRTGLLNIVYEPNYVCAESMVVHHYTSPSFT